MNDFKVGDVVRTGNIRLTSGLNVYDAYTGLPAEVAIPRSYNANRVGKIVGRDGVYWSVEFPNGEKDSFAEWDLEKLDV